MRPVRLDMDGFASFREPTTSTSPDADYFALGRPDRCRQVDRDRRDDLRAVRHRAPLGRTRRRSARPRTDRRPRHRPAGLRRRRRSATSPPASCARTRQRRAAEERAASSASTIRTRSGSARRSTEGSPPTPVTPAVEKLLGLDFEHFCQCVVLPQGEFAEFLHARRRDRRRCCSRSCSAPTSTATSASRPSPRRRRSDSAPICSATSSSGFVDATEAADQIAAARVDELDCSGRTVTEMLPRLDAA